MNNSRRKKLWLMVLAILLTVLLCITYLPNANFLFTVSAQKINAWYPHIGVLWVVIRMFIRPLLALVIAFTLLYILMPWLKTAITYILQKKKEAALVLFSISITLVTAEIILRICGYQPGQINLRSSFHKVNKLVLNEAYLADSNAMTYINPSVSKKIQSFLKTDYKSELGIFIANRKKDTEWENVGGDFRDLGFDYAMVHSFIDHSEFTNYYHSIVNKKNKDSYDSLILNYVISPINEDGFRSIPFRKTSNKKRILLIGDSFTFGYTTTNKVHSFYDLLLAKGFEVYNTGLNDADPPEYEAVAKKYIPLLKPDIVIVDFYMGNDVSYYRQEFVPYQTYNYRTNAGYLQVCPEGVPTSNMYQAYQYAEASAYIPVNNSLFNYYCSKTVITTLLWNATKDVFHYNTENPVLKKFNAQIKAHLLNSPDANSRLQTIKNLCDSNGSKLILSIIPAISPDRKHISYAESDKRLFPNLKYYETHSFIKSDYCTGSDTHFNEAGHKKYAALLTGLIGSVITTNNH